MEVHVLCAYDYEGSAIIEISTNKAKLDKFRDELEAYEKTCPEPAEGCTFSEDCPLFLEYDKKMEAWYESHPLKSKAGCFYSNYAVSTYQVTE